MKDIKFILIFFAFAAWVAGNFVFAETIYTKNGETIKANVSELSNGTLWYETTSGDVTEYQGMDMANVEKVLNDDGSVSQYSPAFNATSK